ncbi:MAG TPA: DNA mismatch repair endonuclease MutL [Edaphocola sp.]|nr:DNA mismatch repair endonuclease MutL [Edaphocola sp.]
MSDIIQLLPDHLANQIAAGEVIQRPASAVKELIENSIDSGADMIQLVVKDAGKELIQVIDNGNGMSPTDARMSFERHATSKIKKIDDLFAITTKGFRGEALASIAAVAQVSVKTKQKDETLGTLIEIESSTVVKQEAIACADGTNISIKNLFYSVPARRHFLKSNTTELRHILDEFTRIALAHPNIGFKFINNNVEQFHLTSGNLKQRILSLLGNNLDKNLIPVEEIADFVTISGFIGKPEAAFKTRGNQFFFVNNRFIKSPYLNHAVNNAFEGLIPKDSFPTYFLFLEIDPQRIDINVHPTKQEIKFDDERILYAYMQSAIKFSLNKFNIAPSIDFTLNTDIQNLEVLRTPINEERKQEVTQGYLYNKYSQGGQAHLIEKKNDRKNWQQQQDTFFPEIPSLGIAKNNEETIIFPSKVSPLFNNNEIGETKPQNVLQWQNYLITTMKSGVVFINQKRALERIIFEQLERNLAKKESVIQQLLFPVSVAFNPADALILSEVINELYAVGFAIHPGSDLHSFEITGVPSGMEGGQEQLILETIIDQIKMGNENIEDQRQTIVIQTMAKRLSTPKNLQQEQAVNLVDELFACAQPQYTPDGQLIFSVLNPENINQYL